MKYNTEEMPLNKNLYNKLFNLCHFNNLKFEVNNGVIFRVEETNINFIEPHRFIINVNDIALILLCYDNLNLYLYNKKTPVNVALIKEIVKTIKEVQ